MGRVHGLGHVEALPGFVVTANAFHAFLEHNNLREAVNKRLCLMEVGNVRLLSSLTLELQELFLAGEVPPKFLQR